MFPGIVFDATSGVRKYAEFHIAQKVQIVRFASREIVCRVSFHHCRAASLTTFGICTRTLKIYIFTYIFQIARASDCYPIQIRFRIGSEFWAFANIMVIHTAYSKTRIWYRNILSSAVHWVSPCEGFVRLVKMFLTQYFQYTFHIIIIRIILWFIANILTDYPFIFHMCRVKCWSCVITYSMKVCQFFYAKYCGDKNDV